MRTRKLIEAKGLLKAGDRVKLSWDNFIGWWVVALANDSTLNCWSEDFEYRGQKYGKKTVWNMPTYIQFRDEASTDIEDVAEGDFTMNEGGNWGVHAVLGNVVIYEGANIATVQWLKNRGWKRVPTKTNPEPETVKIGEQRFLKSDIEKLTPIV